MFVSGASALRSSSFGAASSTDLHPGARVARTPTEKNTGTNTKWSCTRRWSWAPTERCAPLAPTSDACTSFWAGPSRYAARFPEALRGGAPSAWTRTASTRRHRGPRAVARNFDDDSRRPDRHRRIGSGGRGLRAPTPSGFARGSSRRQILRVRVRHIGDGLPLRPPLRRGGARCRARRRRQPTCPSTCASEHFSA